MTYINKTVPKPCDKEVNLYELNEERLYKAGKPFPVKGTLTNCHESRCERYNGSFLYYVTITRFA